MHPIESYVKIGQRFNSSFTANMIGIYMIHPRTVSHAVVAQPGRALDQLMWGEAEDRAVVSSNLTDGTYGWK